MKPFSDNVVVADTEFSNLAPTNGRGDAEWDTKPTVRYLVRYQPEGQQL